MREIKFRAWDRTENIWVEAVTYTLHTSGRLVTVPPDIELMQYTGLKDAKGQDIYEGDIVQYDAIDTYGVVTWVSNSPGFVILNPEKSGMFVLHSEWEIIGNIYENAEYLTQGTDA